MSDLDVRIFSGYITLQLGLAAWMLSKGTTLIQTIDAQVGMFVVDIGLSFLATYAYWVNQRRRRDAVGVLRRLSRALCFLEKDAYLDGEAIQEEVFYRPWIPAYMFSVLLASCGVTAIIFSGHLLRSALAICPQIVLFLAWLGWRVYSSHRERRFQSKLNSESGEAERSSKR